jgi:hypothetical protein
MCLAVVIALVVALGLVPVSTAVAASPYASLLGVWDVTSNCSGTVCGDTITISIGGQEAIDPLCTPGVLCMTTANTSSMGGFFFAENISLAPNGAGNWVWTCKGCTGWETIEVHFKGRTFTGTALPGPVSAGEQPLPYDGVQTGVPPSLTVSISLPLSTLPVGKTEEVEVIVTAIGGNITGIDLSQGLVSSGPSVVVTNSPPGVSGFSVAVGQPRSLHFTIKGSSTGTATLSAAAQGQSSVGTVSASGQARLRVTGGPLDVDWAMPSRTIPETADWSNPYGLPTAEFVSPRDWQVQLFLTKDGSRTCPTGVTFDWTITGEGSSGTPVSDHCDVNAYVKKLGVYRVTAKEMRDGKPTGTTATDDHVLVRDWLIIGLGDSNGSGQGNAPYVDGLCDRSVKSYQYQAAKYIEDQDPHSSVTFVWDACSGAHTDQLWKNSYEGQEPSGGDVLPPQIEQVKSVIGKRKPDAIIMSVGINDLSFSAIMTFCAFYVPSHGSSRDCQDAPVTPTTDQLGYTTRYTPSDSKSSETLAQRTAVQLNSLGGKLQALSAPLAGLDAAHVFITEYPNESTDQTGQLCNNTGPRPRFSSGVWGWLQHVGTGLNGVIAGTASFGWAPVTGVAEGFIGHGYCSTDSYFDTVEQSLSDQHNAIGAFHPNETGAAITASLTRAKVCQALYGNPDCSGLPPPPQ